MKKEGNKVLFYIKEKIISFGDHFSIYNSGDREVYRVEEKLMTIGNQLTMYDSGHNEVVYIKQKPMNFLDTYELLVGNKVVARMKKKFTLLYKQIEVESIFGNYTIDGSLFQFNFSIHKNNARVAEISKELLSFSDGYSIDIAEDESYPLILAMVIVIDQILHNNN